jgi:hypothetical protein
MSTDLVFFRRICKSIFQKAKSIIFLRKCYRLITAGFIILASSTLFRKRINKEKTIDVFFIVLDFPTWKLTKVYKEFNDDKRFITKIIIVPNLNCPTELSVKNLNETYLKFYNKGYTVYKYNENDIEINLTKISDNKVIFFANPHNITCKKYQALNFLRDMTYYVPYHHQIDNNQWESQWNGLFHLSMTQLFYVSSWHKEISTKVMFNKGRNVISTGYPATEDLHLIEPYNEKYDPWPIQARNKLKIIFAPHHTIEYQKGLGVNEFLNVASNFKELAIKYSSRIHIAFKPHPMLKTKLYSDAIWGKEKTDEYYSFWHRNENTQVEEGEYKALFQYSDCMIHDSGSFLAEYLYVNKPVMYLINKTTKSRFNDYGLKLLDCCFVDKCNNIEGFIKNLLSGIDDNAEIRKKTIEKYLIKKGIFTKPSRLIYEKIVSHIFD